MDKDLFVKEIYNLGIELDKEQLEQLEKYYKLLVEWNKKINLTRIIDEKEVYLKHFYDSITLSKAIDLNRNLLLCDIGTGAGFPGLVLKIVFPSLSITLIDSLQKRINFLNTVIKELNLNNIIAIHSRAEDYIREHQNEYDIVTCRALANLSKLLPYSIPLIKKDGFFVPMKANCDEEIMESMPIIKRMNCEIVEKIEFDLPIENSHRTILKIKKIKKSLKK